MLIIETNLTVSSSSSWVLDSDSSAHLCSSMQDLEEVRGLREDEITLRVDNRARVAVVAIGIYPPQLPLRSSLFLKDCYSVSIVSRNLFSISVLV